MPQEHPSQEAPDWRYAVACAELNAEQSGQPLYSACQDFSVKHLKQVLRLVREPAIPPPLVVATLGAVSELVRWYERSTDTRFFLEALMLGRADDETICAKLNRNLRPPMLQLYRSWFFDVSERLDQELWIENNVLRPALYRAQAEREEVKRIRLHTAYIWKILGFYSGYERLLIAMSSGLIYDAQTMQFLRKLCISHNMRTVVQTLADTVHDEFSLQQRTQVHAWSSDDARAEREAGGGDEEDTGRVSEAFYARLNPAPASGKVEKIERISAPTYTEEDLPHGR